MNKYATIAIIVLLGIIALSSLTPKRGGGVLGGSIGTLPPTINSLASSTLAIVPANCTSQQGIANDAILVSTTSNRQWLQITSTSSLIFLQFDGQPAISTATPRGITISSTTPYEIDNTALYVGTIRGCSNNASSSVYVIQGTN